MPVASIVTLAEALTFGRKAARFSAVMVLLMLTSPVTEFAARPEALAASALSCAIDMAFWPEPASTEVMRPSVRPPVTYAATFVR